MATFIITGQQALLIVNSQYVEVAATNATGKLPSPYNANPWDFILIDTSLGNVVINLPQLNGLGTQVTIHHDDATKTSLATYSVTVNGPSGVQLAQPAPNNGSFNSSYSFTGTQYAGTELTWFNGGSTGGYLVR